MRTGTEEELFNELKADAVDLGQLIDWLKSESRYIKQQLKLLNIDFVDLALEYVRVSKQPSSKNLSFIPGRTLREILRKTIIAIRREGHRSKIKQEAIKRAELEQGELRKLSFDRDCSTALEFIEARDSLNSHRSTVAEFSLIVGKRKSTVRSWIKAGRIPTSNGSIRTAEALKALGLLSHLVSGLVDPRPA